MLLTSLPASSTCPSNPVPDSSLRSCLQTPVQSCLTCFTASYCSHDLFLVANRAQYLLHASCLSNHMAALPVPYSFSAALRHLHKLFPLLNHQSLLCTTSSFSHSGLLGKSFPTIRLQRRSSSPLIFLTLVIAARVYCPSPTPEHLVQEDQDPLCPWYPA